MAGDGRGGAGVAVKVSPWRVWREFVVDVGRMLNNILHEYIILSYSTRKDRGWLKGGLVSVLDLATRFVG